MLGGFAYPFRLVNSEREPEIVKNCGFSYAGTVNSTYNYYLPNDFFRWNPTCHHKYVDLKKLTQDFLKAKNDSATLFYLWGHSYEFENDGNWNILEDFCESIAEYKSVWCCTNMEFCNYKNKFSQLEVSANGRIVYNPTDISLFTFIDNKEIEIKFGQTIFL